MVPVGRSRGNHCGGRGSEGACAGVCYSSVRNTSAGLLQHCWGWYVVPQGEREGSMMPAGTSGRGCVDPSHLRVGQSCIRL